MFLADQSHECPLCRKALSRVDSLKRHLAGCSKRHGNPSHLSQPEARVKSDVKNVESQQLANYTTPQNWNGSSYGWPSGPGY